MPRKFFLDCDVKAHYVLEVQARDLTAAKRKAATMLIPGVESPHAAPLWAGSIRQKIRRTTETAAHRAADRSWRKPRRRR